ncbi:MAG TPA: diacylglycerol kinase family protein [Verrucomicrobiae bacterium]|nr:diacylglycerol kinase family protein [Verrucomicrobiae bacterium]
MSTQVRDAVLIVNPAAGGGRAVRKLDAARRIFRNAGIETELQNTGAAGEATIMARRAVEASRQLVIVCGGDGTVNEVVNGLACSQVPLAVLPAGTANVLAKELKIPWNLSRAAERLIGAPYRRIALGLATPEKSSGEPRYFLSVAGAGADGALVSAVRPEIKLKAGILAYWQEGFRQLTRYDFPMFHTTMAGNGVGIDASLVIVGRTKHYGGPFKITTEADLLQPQFELAFVTTRSAWRYIAYLPLIWAGKLRSARYVRFFKTTCLRCASNGGSQVQIQVDGEPAGHLPAEFRIVPDALTLAMPDPL